MRIFRKCSQSCAPDRPGRPGPGLRLAARSALADFALRDGDTVVFLGDSITAARTYGKIVENYTLLRFPDRKVHFLNAGLGRRHGGRRAQAAGARRLRPRARPC